MQYVMLLVIITDMYIGAQGNCACIGFQKAVDYFQNGGLSGAVIANHGYMLPPFDIHVNAGKEGVSAKGFGKPFYMQHVIAADAAGRQDHVDIRAWVCGSVQDFDFA